MTTTTTTTTSLVVGTGLPEPSAPPLAPATLTIVNRPLTFAEHWRGLWRRVFSPSSAPTRYKIRVQVPELGGTGKLSTGIIGKDATYRFHDHICVGSGQNLVVARDDLYVPLKIKPINDYAKMPLILRIFETALCALFFFIRRKPPQLPPYLPSTLFRGAQEAPEIGFKYDRRPVKLVKAPTKHDQTGNEMAALDFPSALEMLRNRHEVFISQKASPYLYEADTDEPNTIPAALDSLIGPNEGGTLLYAFSTADVTVTEVMHRATEDGHQFFSWLETPKAEGEAAGAPVRRTYTVHGQLAEQPYTVDSKTGVFCIRVMKS